MNENKLTNKSNIISFLMVLALIVLQWLLFSSYIERELMQTPFVQGDGVWYLSQSYEIYDKFINEDLYPVDDFKQRWGPLLNITATVFNSLFGPSRTAALATNIIVFLAWQVLIFYAFKRISGSSLWGLFVFGFCLCLQAPFFEMFKFQRDFITLGTFGVFIATVLISDTFLNRHWSLASGCIVAIMILFRYVTLSYLAVIYFFMTLVFVFIVLYKRRGNRDASFYMIRLINILLSGFVVLILIAYPIYLAKETLFLEYLKNFTNSKIIIETYNMGMGKSERVFVLLSDYINTSLGPLFVRVVVMFLLISFVVSMMRVVRFGFSYWVSEIKNSPMMKSMNSNLFLLFTGSCFIIPFTFFCLYSTAHKVFMISMAAPGLTLVCFLLVTLNCGMLQQKNKKITLSILSAIALISILFGVWNQVNQYTTISYPREHRQDIDEISRMYDDIYERCMRYNLTTPAISTDFLEDYTLGGCLNLKTYEYEKRRVLISPHPLLGYPIEYPIELNNSIGLIMASDFIVLNPETDNIKKWGRYQFVHSMEKYRSVIREKVKENFSLIGNYVIGGQTVELYSKNFFISLVDESPSPSSFPASKAFDGIDDSFWEGNFPCWVKLKLGADKPIKMTSYILQTGNHGINGFDSTSRMPKEWEVQGSMDGSAWQTLDLRKNQVDWNINDKRVFSIKEPGAFNYYRLFFKTGNSLNIMRIYEIRMLQ